jgi:hypothetical protein
MIITAIADFTDPSGAKCTLETSFNLQVVLPHLIPMTDPMAIYAQVQNQMAMQNQLQRQQQQQQQAQQQQQQQQHVQMASFGQPWATMSEQSMMGQPMQQA